MLRNIKTYQVLDQEKNIVEYFKLLHDAQKFIVRNFDQKLHIMSLTGPYFGEGKHTHVWTYNASKLLFKRFKI